MKCPVLKLCTFLAAVLVAAGMVQVPQGQTAAVTALPSFDVVSIRQLEPLHATRNALSVTYLQTPHKACLYAGNHLSCQLSLAELVQEAFELQPYQVVGPSWLREDLFAVKAIMPEGTGRSVGRRMLQQALQDRFHLATHIAQRELEVFLMLPGKGGVKLQPAHEDLPSETQAPDRKPTPIALQWSPGTFAASAISADLLGTNLGRIADLPAPVRNNTGLTGNYTVDLHWTQTDDPDSLAKGKDPNILSAAEQQLGLTFKKDRAPLPVLVIEHVDHQPTPN